MATNNSKRNPKDHFFLNLICLIALVSMTFVAGISLFGSPNGNALVMSPFIVLGWRYFYCLFLNFPTLGGVDDSVKKKILFWDFDKKWAFVFGFSTAICLLSVAISNGLKLVFR